MLPPKSDIVLGEQRTKDWLLPILSRACCTCGTPRRVTNRSLCDTPLRRNFPRSAPICGFSCSSKAVKSYGTQKFRRRGVTQSELFGTGGAPTMWYEECPIYSFLRVSRNSKRFKNGAARKFRRSGVSQSERFGTGGDPPMRATSLPWRWPHRMDLAVGRCLTSGNVYR